MTTIQIPFLTRKGRENLGKVLKYYRLKQNWSMGQLVEEIKKMTQYSISKAAISDLPRGNTEPQWNTLAILAAAGYLPYSVDQLFAMPTAQRPHTARYAHALEQINVN